MILREEHHEYGYPYRAFPLENAPPSNQGAGHPLAG